MIGDNVKRLRKERGLSQEELAVRLYVVRQTVSKWEKNLSVPDADVVVRMAEVLDVPVGRLLGIEEKTVSQEALAEELARVTEELARQIERERRTRQVDQVRNRILFFSFLAMLMTMVIQNELVSIVVTGGCILAAVGVLYQNLALLTSETAEDVKLKTLKWTTIVNVIFLVLGIAGSMLFAMDMVTLPEYSEEVFAVLLVSCIMIFAGIVSPKLPFSRHTGLRLPWTVRDEDTWNVAHRVLGWISLPMAFLYIALAWTMRNLEQVSMMIMLMWIGIPGGISYIYYWKKMHGRL